jgi:nucleoside-diphosphate-sugar epimerase
MPSAVPGAMKDATMKLFCYGFGYTANALVDRLSGRDITIAGTRTRAGAKAGIEIAAYCGDGRSAEVATLLAGTTHVLISIPPDLEGDATVRDFAADLAALPDLAWIGYLSTIGVYGDAQGAWVDEYTPANPQSERSLKRFRAENQWRAFGQTHKKHVDIFRLPGIYGPGRSMIEALKAGTAKRIIKPGQVFNRIHVDDIALALDAAMGHAAPGKPGFGLYNLTDDEPAPPQDVVLYAAELLDLPPPPEITFSDAKLSPMGSSFYAESKRVRNTRIKTTLGLRLKYPTYREGLVSILTSR